jgi:60 kDa SS-A/Ro ribonucleoprotein
MPDPLAAVNTRVTPQAEPADPRQARNNAGGYTFTVRDEMQLHRFLTTGTEGGTYYVSERELTKQNADLVLRWAREWPNGLVARVADVSQNGRAPRNNPALFALAAAAGLGDDIGRRAALNALPLVARTGTHLFMFCQYVQQFRGWGRGLRRAAGDWYDAKPEADLAYQVLKYRQRAGWTHRDVLRLAHPSLRNPVHRALADFICGREADLTELPLVDAYVRAQATRDVAEWTRLIGDNRSLSWEMLPDEAHAEPEVWRALIANGMPQTALMRQLPRLTKLGVVGPRDPGTTAVVMSQLADRDRLKKARVHPVNVLVAQRTYAAGHGRGSAWDPVTGITDALDAAFYAAYGAVEPAGKNTLAAVDVSGSMAITAAGLPLSCRELSAAIALVIANTEPQVLIMGFCDRFVPLNIGPRQRLDDAVRAVSALPFGGTDCALPMLWARRNKVAIETFVTITDNETWAGTVHPHQALRAYRDDSGIPARSAVLGMTATECTVADPLDPGSLDIAGMDSSVPQLLANFSRGDI